MTKTDEIMALADSAATEMIHGHYHPFKEKREELRQAIEALTKDAARYQFIREDGLYVLPDGRYAPTVSGEALDILTDIAIDKAIEAAQAEQA